MKSHPRRSIRSMSQRHKGPGGTPTSSTIPSRSLPHPQNQGCPLPLAPKLKIFLHSEVPPRSLC